jgi:hypothetical protein
MEGRGKRSRENKDVIDVTEDKESPIKESSPPKKKSKLSNLESKSSSSTKVGPYPKAHLFKEQGFQYICTNNIRAFGAL